MGFSSVQIRRYLSVASVDPAPMSGTEQMAVSDRRHTDTLGGGLAPPHAHLSDQGRRRTFMRASMSSEKHDSRPHRTSKVAPGDRQSSLLKAGALQSAILNSANFSIIATDDKGIIQLFNVGAERMLGYLA